MHGFQYHCQHGNEHPYRDEEFKKFLQLAPVFTWKYQSVHFLTERASLIFGGKYLIGGYDNSNQFQYPQQTQGPQDPQIHWQKGLQIKRRHSQKINNGKRTENIAQTGVFARFELGVFRCQIQT